MIHKVGNTNGSFGREKEALCSMDKKVESKPVVLILKNHLYEIQINQCADGS
jgi:hypothetical protein